MSPLRALAGAWSLEPSVIAGCLALLAARAATGERGRRGWALWAAGVAVLFLALCSPLDPLADEYLFSAHMVQHMLLTLVAPPLLVAGAPAAALRRALERPWVSRLERALSRPAVGALLALSALAVWHLPGPYDAAVADEEVHVLEHLCLLVAFTLYWWPALTPVPGRRLAPGAAIAHLAAGAVITSAVGILVTFAGAARYAAYAGTRDPLGLLPVLRGSGLGRGDDLVLSGLLMWMGGTPVFLGLALGALRRWYAADAAPPAEVP